MDNKKKITTIVVLMAMVITLGSAVVARKIARGEEGNTGDVYEYERRIDDVTIDGAKLVYRDKSVSYLKLVVLRYSVNTDKYTEDTYYWFNTDEEYQEHFRTLGNIRIDYNPEIKYVRTMTDIKEKPFIDNMNELKNNKNIEIIR